MLKTIKGLLLIFVVVIFFVVNCKKEISLSKTKYNYINYKKLVHPEKITKLYSEVVISEEIINRIEYFAIIDDYIILIDCKDDKQIKIFDLHSHKLLKSFGRRGQGPSEFIGARQIIPCLENKKMFWVYDLLTRKLKKFSINKIFKENTDLPEKIINISVTKGYGFPFWLEIIPDNKILGVGNFFKGRISVYNMNGSFFEKYW